MSERVSAPSVETFAWHYRAGNAKGTVVGSALEAEKDAREWIARQHGVDISEVVCHTADAGKGSQERKMAQSMRDKHLYPEWIEQTEEVERRAVETQIQAIESQMKALLDIDADRALMNGINELLAEFKKLENRLRGNL